MGLFGFGKKKKETESEAQKVFKDLGLETNDAKMPGQQTRKQAVAENNKMRVSAVKKDQLLEKMSYLRKEMYSNPDFDGYCTQLEDIIGKLKRMQDNGNKEAMAVVDNFILKTITNAINYCNRGNYIAMGACIDNLNKYVNDRLQCGNYYTNAQFCKLNLERDRVYVEQQNLQSEYDNLEKRMAQLKLDSTKPGISKESIARAAAAIKAEGARKKQLLDKAEARIQVLDKSIDVLRGSDMDHGFVDYETELDDIFETKRENEINDSNIDKYNDKLDQSNRRVSTSALNVNDSVIENDTPIELNDDLFKM